MSRSITTRPAPVAVLIGAAAGIIVVFLNLLIPRLVHLEVHPGRVSSLLVFVRVFGFFAYVLTGFVAAMVIERGQRVARAAWTGATAGLLVVMLGWSIMLVQLAMYSALKTVFLDGHYLAMRLLWSTVGIALAAGSAWATARLTSSSIQNVEPHGD